MPTLLTLLQYVMFGYTTRWFFFPVVMHLLIAILRMDNHAWQDRDESATLPVLCCYLLRGFQPFWWGYDLSHPNQLCLIYFFLLLTSPIPEIPCRVPLSWPGGCCIPGRTVSAQKPETTVLVPTGTTRDIEFIASNPGDWAMHCHMTHHVMNQMGHEFPNMIGMKPRNLDQKVSALLPSYMTMGTSGMGEMGKHVGMGHMAVPQNSIPMVGAKGPFDYITMGGMFTIVKIREDLENYDDPGWYSYPKGSVAKPASPTELKQDGISV